MVIPYHRDLHRPLEGPRNFHVEQRGPFTIRTDVQHLCESVCAVARRKRQEETERRVRAMRVTRILEMMS